MGQTPRPTSDSDGPPDEAAERLIARLQALYAANRAVLELIALGPAAIPALRRFLFRRELSGLYQPRCDAVAALAGLKADDVLLDFLEAAPAVVITDPVERTGEDAVINAAARALKHRRNNEVFAALMGLAEQRRLAGVIEALGQMKRPEAIPRLIEGLASDYTRPAAEAALRKTGSGARPALIKLALSPIPSADFETASSLRTRRSAVTVLCDIGVTQREWSVLSPLMDAADDRLAALASGLALSTDQPTLAKEPAVHRLIRLLKSADWLLTVEIEGWLVEHYDLTSGIVARALVGADSSLQGGKIREALLRVAAKIAEADLARLAQP